MHYVSELFAGNEATHFIVSVLIQATLVIVLALSAGRVLRHQPLLRHSVLLGGLLCVCFCPAASYLADRVGVPLISITSPSNLASDTTRPGRSTKSREATTDPAPDAVAIALEPIPSARTAEDSILLDLSQSDVLSAPQTVSLPDSSPVSGTASKQSASEQVTIASEPELPDDTLTVSAGSEIATGSLWTADLTIVGWIWLTGLAVISVRLWLAWRYLSRLRSNASSLDKQSLSLLREVREQVLQAVAAKHLPAVLVSDALQGPISLGLLRPAIILPTKMIAALNASQFRDVLIHETAHIHRRDHLVVLIQRLAGAVFWPFPLVRRLNTKIDEAREDVCDNYVLRNTEASRYSRMLLELTERAAPQVIPLSIGLRNCRRQLEQRVTALLDPRRKTRTRLPRRTVCTLTVAFVSIAVFLAGARIVPVSYSQAADSGQFAREEAQSPANEDAESDVKQASANDSTAMSVKESASPEHAAMLAENRSIEPLLNRKEAFSNRPYWWELPKDLPFRRFIRIGVGKKEDQKIRIERAGWIHVALARQGPSNPSGGFDPDRPRPRDTDLYVNEFAEKYGFEKTDMTIGYRVPLHARATRMFIYRKKVPVGELTIPRVNWSGPVVLLPDTDRKREEVSATDPYDRLYDVVMTRWKDGKTYARDETSPAIFAWSAFPFDDQTFDEFNAALDAFDALSQEEIDQYSDVQRALMQRNLWEVFDTTFNWNWPDDWWWDGQRSFPKTHLDRRSIAQPKIAALMKRLALTKKQILALPNPMAATIKSGRYAEAYDPANPFQPFLPQDLHRSTESSWICVGEDGNEIPADLHTGNSHSRSMFLQFMRLPGGRAETLEYMERIRQRPHQFPVGTQFALLEQPFLISKDGELVLSPLVVSVQLRAYLDIGRDFQRYSAEPKATQCVAEFVMHPRQLMQGNAVMKVMGSKDFRFDAGSETPTPGFSPRDPFATGPIAAGMPPTRLNQCMDCHDRAGGRGVRTRSFKGTSEFFTVGNPEDIGRATAAQKLEDAQYLTLQKYWRGEPVELPKPIAQRKPKTQPEPRPDRFPDSPKLRQNLLERIQIEIAAELSTIHTAILHAEVAKLAEMFDLDETESSMLRQAAQQAARSAVEKAHGSIVASFRSGFTNTLDGNDPFGNKNDVDLTAFRFNDRYIRLNPRADEQGPADRQPSDSLRFKLKRRVLHDWLSVGFRYGTQGNTVGPKDSDVQSEEVWQKALAAVLTEEQIRQYLRQTTNSLKATVVDMILTALQFDLDLQDSQLPVVRRRIEERVSIRQSAYGDIESAVGRELQRLKAEAFGDILSQEQLNAFPEHPESRIKSTIISLILRELQFDLHLADSHLPAVRKRLEKLINPGQPSLSIEAKAMRMRWRLKEKDVADILTEPELVLWRLTQEQHN